VEHEKKTFFSLLKNTRSEDGHRSGGYSRRQPRLETHSSLDPLIATR
jgi:hypothetical protein